MGQLVALPVPVHAVPAPLADGTLLSVKSAAKRLDVPEPTLRKWLAERRLPVVKLGRLTRLRVTDLDGLAMTGLPPKGAYPRPLEPRGAAA
jgi:excisionase family DNA binding protein